MAADGSSVADPLAAGKFRGCLLGALLGDCFGSPFEYVRGDPVPSELQKFFDEKETSKSSEPNMNYTDDTAMTMSIAKSFVAKGCLDEKDVAERFTNEFFSDAIRVREYGGHVRTVFRKLKAQNCSDVYGPAKEQFKGSGSLGNGGAMRIAPVPLFCFSSEYEYMLHVVRRVTEITHTNPLGVNGAILECLAIYQALHLDPSLGSLDVHRFIDDLIIKMEAIEKPAAGTLSWMWRKFLSIFQRAREEMPYVKKLQVMKEFLARKEGVTKSEVQQALGNDCSALDSVPTAIYSFLRAQESIPEVKTENKFRRTLQCAILFGGDTDTIGCMAGAIAGAYFGDTAIEDSLKSHCEKHNVVSDLADSLYKLTKTLK